VLSHGVLLEVQRQAGLWVCRPGPDGQAGWIGVGAGQAPGVVVTGSAPEVEGQAAEPAVVPLVLVTVTVAVAQARLGPISSITTSMRRISRPSLGPRSGV
jgi:hypothetical protein